MRFRQSRVSVGYSAPYSLRVHEDLQARHTNGIAKYLEQPARENADEIARAAERVLVQGGSLAEALKAGGETLLGMSRALVPVLTGKLRDSGHVRVE